MLKIKDFSILLVNVHKNEQKNHAMFMLMYKYSIKLQKYSKSA